MCGGALVSMYSGTMASTGLIRFSGHLPINSFFNFINLSDYLRRFKVRALRCCQTLAGPQSLSADPCDLYTLQEIYQRQLFVLCHRLDTRRFTAVVVH